MGKCPKCGKGLGFFGVGLPWESEHFHNEWNGQKLHQECWSQAIKEESEYVERLTLCDNCYYYRTYSSEIDVGILNPKYVTLKSKYCAKFGFSLKDGSEAEECTSYITGEDYKTKSLRGEINPQTDTIFKICGYCKVKYDQNKVSVCPKCGAS